MKKIVEKLKSFFQKFGLKRIRVYITKHKIISTIIILVLLYSSYYLYTKLFTGSSTIEYTFGKVSRGDLVVSVLGSGQASTLSQVDIKPKSTGQTQMLGQIVSVKVKNGDYVKAGDVVAILDGKNALQTLNQAKASVASAQANYNKLVNGLTETDLFSLNNSIQNSQVSLDNLKQNILIKLQNAYTSVSGSIYFNTDSIFENNPVNMITQIKIQGVSIINQQLENNIESGRYDIEPLLISWKDELKNISVASDLPNILNTKISNLRKIRSYFDDMTILLSVYSSASNSTAQSLLNSYKSAASSARSAVDSSISDLTSALQSYNSAVVSLSQNKESLTLKQKPPSEDDLTVSKAQLDNAKANLANAEESYSSRIISAPFDGQIGGLVAQVGQQVSSSDSLGKLITSKKVINVTLNEVDAAKVTAGNPVTITFDSLPGISLTGLVSYVDPLGTVTQGVVSYAVQISINEQNDQIKTGMTASVGIITNQHFGVLVVPTSAITSSKGKKYVLVADTSGDIIQNNLASSTDFRNLASSTRNGNSDTGTSTHRFSSSTFASSSFKNLSNITTQYPVIQVEIITGLSNNTQTEVLSGLSGGELIVLKKTTVTSGASSATKTAASAATSRTGGGIVPGGFGSRGL